MSWHAPSSFSVRFAACLLLVMECLLSSTGCLRKQKVIGPERKIHTAFHEELIERRPVHRVVVLPVENLSASSNETLQEFRSELAAKIREKGIYEVVEVPVHAVPACRPEWIQSGKFPERLLVDLYKNYSADGVIFVSLNRFSSYPPVTIAATAHLVDTDEGIVLTSVDGTWSTSNQHVERRLRAQLKLESHPTPELMMQSPRYISTFVADDIAEEFGRRVHVSGEN